MHSNQTQKKQFDFHEICILPHDRSLDEPSDNHNRLSLPCCQATENDRLQCDLDGWIGHSFHHRIDRQFRLQTSNDENDKLKPTAKQKPYDVTAAVHDPGLDCGRACAVAQV